ncbi:unnamed protein product [Calypogeia fissa]
MESGKGLTVLEAARAGNRGSKGIMPKVKRIMLCGERIIVHLYTSLPIILSTRIRKKWIWKKARLPGMTVCGNHDWDL